MRSKTLGWLSQSRPIPEVYPRALRAIEWATCHSVRLPSERDTDQPVPWKLGPQANNNVSVILLLLLLLLLSRFIRDTQHDLFLSFTMEIPSRFWTAFNSAVCLNHPPLFEAKNFVVVFPDTLQRNASFVLTMGTRSSPQWWSGHSTTPHYVLNLWSPTCNTVNRIIVYLRFLPFAETDDTK